MSISFRANEFEAFVLTGNANLAFVTTAGSYDTALCRGSMRFGGGSTAAFSFASLTDFWTSFDYFFSSNFGFSAPAQPAIVLTNAGQGFLRLLTVNPGSLQLQWSSNGSAWTNIGSSFAFTGAVRYRVGLYIKLNASGTYEFYVDGSLKASFSGDTTVHAAACTGGQLSSRGVGTDSDNTCMFSQVVVSPEDNRSKKVGTINLSGAGTANAWTGAYSDINGSAVPADSTLLTTTGNNNVATFTITDNWSGAYLGYTVDEVALSCRAERSAGGGPQNLQLAIRRASTNYFSASVSGLDTIFKPFQAVWTTDPSTSAAWAKAGIDAAEIGAKSIA